MTAPDIPEDIRAIAEELGYTFAVADLEGPAIEEIALALLSERTRATEAERERCAKIADADADSFKFNSPQGITGRAIAYAIRNDECPPASIRTEGTATAIEPGFTKPLSEETKAALDAIDENIRYAARHAGSFIVGRTEGTKP